MNNRQFKIGQTVWILIGGQRKDKPIEERLKEAIVVKSGPKYTTVVRKENFEHYEEFKQKYLERRFHVYNGYEAEDNSYTNYDHKLFRSKEDAMNSEKAEALYKEINYVLSRPSFNSTSLTLEQLEKIHEIIFGKESNEEEIPMF